MPRPSKNEKPLLAVDIGNTNVHWGFLRPHDLKILRQGTFPTQKKPDWSALPFPQARAVVYCSVVPAAARSLARHLKDKNAPALALTQKNFPLPIRYDTPHTLGHDRLALALGALALGCKQAVVVDVGTAVTTDIVAAQKGFLGGFITPGLGLMLTSLHRRTAQLPHIHPDTADHSGPVGRSTATAIANGCAVAFAGGLTSLIQSARKNLGPRAKIVVTGRGERFFPKNIRHIREDNLSLIGLAAFAATTRPL